MCAPVVLTDDQVLAIPGIVEVFKNLAIIGALMLVRNTMAAPATSAALASSARPPQVPQQEAVARESKVDDCYLLD